eukprot:tig00020515_g9769.t1
MAPYTAEAYARAIREEQLRQAATVFAAIFDPSGEYLVCADSLGRIVVWSLNDLIHTNWHVTGQSPPRPLASFRAHECGIYCATFYPGSPSPRLITGSDEDIRVWDFQSIVHWGRAAAQGSAPSPLATIENPRATSSRGAQGPRSETNGLAIDASAGLFFSAAGDGNAYGWDAERCQLVAEFRGHRNYLHCVAARPRYGQILTGSEDGTVRLWDARRGGNAGCIAVLDPAKGATAESGAPKGGPWVGCVAVDPAESFLVCGGGSSSISIIHLGPAGHMPLVASTPTAGAPQCLSFADEQILVGGSGGRVERFTARGAPSLSLRASAPSVFAATLNEAGPPGNRVLVAGGSLPVVDVFSGLGSRMFSVSC